MKNKAILVFLGFAAVFALPAMAQKVASGFYVGAGIGQATSTSYCEGAGTPCLDTDTTWRAFGGYQISRYFAVEGAYQYLGAPNDISVPKDYKAQAGELVGIAALPIFSEVDVFGKGGVYKGRIRGANPAGSFNESNTDVTFGLGIQWRLHDSLNLRGEFQRYPRMGGGNSGPSTDFDVWTVSAIFRFQ